MAKPPERKHKITKAEAKALMAKPPKGLATKGGYFPKDAVQAILDQPGCTGLRFYYGTNPDESPAIVMLGMDENSADMTDGEIIDTHFPCPPFCDDGSDLRK